MQERGGGSKLLQQQAYHSRHTYNTIGHTSPCRTSDGVGVIFIDSTIPLERYFYLLIDYSQNRIAGLCILFLYELKIIVARTLIMKVLLSKIDIGESHSSYSLTVYKTSHIRLPQFYKYSLRSEITVHALYQSPAETRVTSTSRLIFFEANTSVS